MADDAACGTGLCSVTPARRPLRSLDVRCAAVPALLLLTSACGSRSTGASGADASTLSEAGADGAYLADDGGGGSDGEAPSCGSPNGCGPMVCPWGAYCLVTFDGGAAPSYSCVQFCYCANVQGVGCVWGCNGSTSSYGFHLPEGCTCSPPNWGGAPVTVTCGAPSPPADAGADSAADAATDSHAESAADAASE